MNAFDTNIVSFFNHLSQRSWIFDHLVVLLDHDLFKGGVIMAVLWWGWFATCGDQRTRRGYLLSAIVAGMIAVALARGLALSLPFRERPLHVESLAFRVPLGLNQETLEGWSSFPSDHAALFFALATGVFFASRRLGIFAYLWAIFVVCLPRLYLGEHWPTDLIAGAAIGSLTGAVVCASPLRTWLGRYAETWERRHAPSMYVALFLLTTQTSQLFSDSRGVVRFLHDAARHLY